MASGLAMYDALREATRDLPVGSTFSINVLDKEDLRKLKPSDLVARRFDEVVAERVSNDLLNGRLDELGKSLGLRLETRREVLGLIPGEGFRRSVNDPLEDGQSPEEMLRELDEIRHPERYAR